MQLRPFLVQGRGGDDHPVVEFAARPQRDDVPTPDPDRLLLKTQIVSRSGFLRAYRVSSKNERRDETDRFAHLFEHLFRVETSR